MAGALSGVMTTVVMAPGERIKSLLQVRGEFSLELSTNLCEVSQWLEKTPNRDIFLLKAPTFTMKHLLRHYAKLTFKHGK